LFRTLEAKEEFGGFFDAVDDNSEALEVDGLEDPLSGVSVAEDPS
jgi:hypothetical protein